MSNKTNDQIIEDLIVEYIQLGGDLNTVPVGMSDMEMINYFTSEIKQLKNELDK